jgi:SH3-like domain-containing protein
MWRILATTLSLVVLFYSFPTPTVAAQVVATATRTPAPIRMFVSAVPAARVRSGPSESFPILTTLPTGAEVQVYEASGEWRKIRCSKLTDYVWIHGSLISEMASSTPVPTNTRGPLSANRPEAAETATMSDLLARICLGAALIALTSIVFPIWAASYASGRGHNGWAVVAVLSIFVGCGSVAGFIAWLASRGDPVIASTSSTRRQDVAAPEPSDDHDPDPRWEAQQDREERERRREQEIQEEYEGKQEVREAKEEAGRQEWNDFYEQKEQDRIDRLYEEREERYQRSRDDSDE